MFSALKNDEGKALISLTLPIVAEQAFISLMAIVIAGMAGRAGTEVASAVSLVSALANVVQFTIGSIALGGTVVVSRAIGAGLRDDADRAAAQTLSLSVALAVAVGLFFCLFPRWTVEVLFGASNPAVRKAAAEFLVSSALGFPFLAATMGASAVLRGAGDSRTPMIGNILMMAVNVAAGRVFIFGTGLLPPLGAFGAGLALTVARIAGTGFYAVALLRGAGAFRLRRVAPFVPERATVSAIMAIGVPTAVEAFAFNGGKLLTQTYVSGLPAVDIAADYIAFSTALFTQVPITSIAMAVPALVGQAVGRGDAKSARRFFTVSVLMACLVMAAVSAISLILADPIIGASTEDPAVRRRAVGLFRFFLVFCPVFWPASFITPSGLRGAGDARYPMGVAVFSMWTMRVGLGWALAYPAGLGILGVWIAMIIDWVVRGAFFVARVRSGKWLKT